MQGGSGYERFGPSPEAWGQAIGELTAAQLANEDLERQRRVNEARMQALLDGFREQARAMNQGYGSVEL